MPVGRRALFRKNIGDESRRIQDLVDRLLELSALEKRRGLADVPDIRLDELLAEVVSGLAPVADAKQMTILVEGGAGISLSGERFLPHRALANLLANAIDFSSAGQQVMLTVEPLRKHCEISIGDHGPGIPDYALDRVFEKFYSLARPGSGKRRNGVGPELRQGDRRVASRPGGVA